MKFLIKKPDGTQHNLIEADLDFVLATLPEGHTYEAIPEPVKVADQVRARRDQLLTASDWTQTADAPVDQVEWQDYRQALRDIPQQAGFPTDITWPTKPE